MIYYLDIFNFNYSKFWIFKLMGSYTFNKTIFNSSGLEFFKLLGTGSRNGFSIYPDFSTYITISSFIDEESRLNFLNHYLLKQMIDKSSFRIEKLIEPYQSKGTWNGINPFKINSSYRGGEILVLTRARVRPIKILNFLINTSYASKSIKGFKGVSFYKGIGELPVIEQATVSIWDNENFMKKYAYENRSHQDVISKSRKQNWYSEEMFMRFNVLETREYNG